MIPRKSFHRTIKDAAARGIVIVTAVGNDYESVNFSVGLPGILAVFRGSRWPLRSNSDGACTWADRHAEGPRRAHERSSLLAVRNSAVEFGIPRFASAD